MSPRSARPVLGTMVDHWGVFFGMVLENKVVGSSRLRRNEIHVLLPQKIRVSMMARFVGRAQPRLARQNDSVTPTMVAAAAWTDTLKTRDSVL